MTDRLYQRDMTVRQCGATVLAQRAEGVVLDRTCFFPTGGGVLGDTGQMMVPGAFWRVMDTVEINGQIVHCMEGAMPREATQLTASLDWDRRYRLMRTHTATHVLTGVMFQDFDVRVTGNQLTPEKGRVDFNFPDFDRSVLEEGFRRANALIDQDLEVRVSFLAAAEARNRPELFKLETEFPHDLDEVRLVEIVGFDTQADGGCHVARLGEVGHLTLTKAENKGKANRRVYFTLE